MRIAHVIDSMEVGGAETLVATLCRIQRRMGHDPSVHCLFRGGKLGERLAAEGVPVYLHGPGPIWRAGMRLYRRFREEPPAVVHCHNATATIAGAPAARMAGIRPVISTRHGMVPPGRFFRREIKFWLAARLCGFVVAVCETARDNLRRGPAAIPESIVTIYNCAAAPVRTGDGAPVEKDGFTLINVARHSAEKDLAALLEALAIARRERPDLRLWLLGNGALTEGLKAKAAALGLEKHVSFPGERSDVGDWLCTADLFVMSSVSEGLPVALLEAMAAGVPQIVTCVGGMPEVVRISGGGVVVPPRDPAALAAAVIELAGDPRRLSDLGARSRRCYEQRFTPERMGSEYLELYTECGART